MKDEITIEKARDYNTASVIVVKYIKDHHLSLEDTMALHNFIEWATKEVRKLKVESE